MLRRVIHELIGELRGSNQKLPRELQGLTAVDGTFLRAVPRMAWALFRTNYRGVMFRPSWKWSDPPVR